MTLEQLLTLENIVKYGSFKSAAEAMHKSQPSLTMAIKKLEDEFDILIFDRSGYRPKLTNNGETFYKKAQKVLDSFKDLEQLGQELGAGYEPEIKICTDAIFPISKISHIFANFFEPYITTSLVLSTDVLTGVSYKLENHEVDIALASNVINESDVEKIKIAEIKMIPVIGTKLLESRNGEIDLEFLKQLPQIVVESSQRGKDKQVKGAISENHWYTTDFSMKQQLIMSGLGWGNLPEHQVDGQIKLGNLSEVKNVAEIHPLSVPMYALRSRTKFMGPNTKNLWNYLVNFALENQD